MSSSSSDAPPTQTPPSDRLESAPSTFEQCIRQAQVGASVFACASVCVSSGHGPRRTFNAGGGDGSGSVVVVVVGGGGGGGGGGRGDGGGVVVVVVVVVVVLGLMVVLMLLLLLRVVVAFAVVDVVVVGIIGPCPGVFATRRWAG